LLIIRADEETDRTSLYLKIFLYFTPFWRKGGSQALRIAMRVLYSYIKDKIYFAIDSIIQNVKAKKALAAGNNKTWHLYQAYTILFSYPIAYLAVGN
jgi:hypothetical protein